MAQIQMITGESANTVRGWIHRKHLTRNEWGLIDPDQLWEYLAKRGVTV